MFASTRDCQECQKIYLKRDQLNEVLLCYLRQVLKEEFFPKKGPEYKSILITKPTHLEFEIYCLEKYVAIMKQLMDQKEKITSLEGDLDMLETEKLSEN